MDENYVFLEFFYDLMADTYMLNLDINMQISLFQMNGLINVEYSVDFFNELQ